MHFKGKLGSAVVLGAMLALLVVGSVFAADPYASAIAAATATTQSDYQAIVADVFPVLAGLAVITLLARRGLGFLRGR